MRSPCIVFCALVLPSFLHGTPVQVERHKRSPGDMSNMKQIIQSDGKTLFIDIPSKFKRQTGSIRSKIPKHLNEDGLRSIRQTENFRAPHRIGKFPDSFCHLPRDSGNICPKLKRGVYLEHYHYVPEENRCSRFTYNGCGNYFHYKYTFSMNVIT